MNDKFDVLTIWKEIIEKNKIKNYISFIVGLFLTAFTFSLFYHPNNIVCGGTTGLSVIVDEIFGVNPSLFIAIASLILLIFA